MFGDLSYYIYCPNHQLTPVETKNFPLAIHVIHSDNDVAHMTSRQTDSVDTIDKRQKYSIIVIQSLLVEISVLCSLSQLKLYRVVWRSPEPAMRNGFKANYCNYLTI